MTEKHNLHQDLNMLLSTTRLKHDDKVLLAYYVGLKIKIMIEVKI